MTEEFSSKIAIYDTYISELTVAEIKRTPDQSLRNKMRQVIKKFSILEVNEAVEELAAEYIKYGAVPESYSEDGEYLKESKICRNNCTRRITVKRR